MPLPPIFNVKTVHPNAVLPSKAHPNDVGFDLTLVSKDSELSPLVTLYDTGIVITPNEDSYEDNCLDYYIEVVPRSSLVKTGHILANSVGIIDPEYQGTIKVALMKVDPAAEALTLPFRAVQIIVRRNYQDAIFQKTSGDFRVSSRGDGAFGSTNIPSAAVDLKTQVPVSMPPLSRRQPRP